jgi:hypothetical protein
MYEGHYDVIWKLGRSYFVSLQAMLILKQIGI